MICSHKSNDITADHDRAQWGLARRQKTGHHKNSIKTHEAKWQLDFTGRKYDFAGEDKKQL
jgi:hypothetical protein